MLSYLPKHVKFAMGKIMKLPLTAIRDKDNLDKSLMRFAEDVFYGLSQPVKRLPCKYIYDAEGSALFSRIMDLPEYYPTRCEMEIFETRRSELAEALGGAASKVVELGAGDGQKTCILIETLLDRKCDFTYVPLDISEDAVNGLADRFSCEYPGLPVNGIISDYFEGLKWLSGQDHCRNIILFLGSTIGNFTPHGCRHFLKNLRRAINPGDMVLIGFDMVKEIDVIVRAYNDPEGVTAEFNRNILRRINRELDGEFDLDGFRYYSTWDVNSRTVQSYQVSCRRQRVRIGRLARAFEFHPWEPIHTESSHKFTQEEISRLASENGFAVTARFFDSRRYFLDCLWQAI